MEQSVDVADGGQVVGFTGDRGVPCDVHIVAELIFG